MKNLRKILYTLLTVGALVCSGSAYAKSLGGNVTAAPAAALANITAAPAASAALANNTNTTVDEQQLAVGTLAAPAAVAAPAAELANLTAPAAVAELANVTQQQQQQLAKKVPAPAAAVVANLTAPAYVGGIA